MKFICIFLAILIFLVFFDGCMSKSLQREKAPDETNGIVKKKEHDSSNGRNEPPPVREEKIEYVKEKAFNHKLLFCDRDSNCPKYYRCQPTGICGENCPNQTPCPPLLLNKCSSDKDCKVPYANCLKGQCTIRKLCSRSYCSPPNCNNNQHCDQKKKCPKCVNHVCRYGENGGCLSDKDCPEKTYCDDCGNCTPWCKTKQDCKEPSSDTCTIQCLKGRCIETCKQLIYEPASSDAGLTSD